jgi:hypothetical protein
MRSPSSRGTAESRPMKIDASERRLLNAVATGEWTASRLATARVRYAGFATATLYRLRKV